MARKASRQTADAAGPQTVKVTLRLSVQTAQRLGVEAAMTRQTQSAIAESVLASYLGGWRLPSKVGGLGTPPAENAAEGDPAA